MKTIPVTVALTLGWWVLPAWAVSREHQDPTCALPHDMPVRATFDCKIAGQWTYVCTGHFRAHGRGLNPNIGVRLAPTNPGNIPDPITTEGQS